MKRVLTLVLCGTLVVSGCASTTGGRIAGPATPEQTQGMAGFLAQLPVGTRVQVELRDGHRFRATLLGVQDDTVTFRPRTRLPEPPIEVKLAEVARVETDSSGGLAKAIAIGAAAGAGAALGVMLILWAIIGDD